MAIKCGASAFASLRLYFLENTVQLYGQVIQIICCTCIVLGWTIGIYLRLNGGAFVPSIVTGRDGPLCRKNPNYNALYVKLHIEISVAYH